MNYLKRKSIYNEETIKCLLDHYRCYMKPRIVGENFLPILSIIISVSLAFISKDGFDINSFNTSIPYLLSIIILFIMVYYSISKVTEIKKVFTGEDGMIERLENVFSELYIELVTKQKKNVAVKTSKKKRRKK